MKVFDGKKLADKIATELKNQVAQLPITPKLAIVAINPTTPTNRYLQAKRARAEELGIELELSLFHSQPQSLIEQTLQHLAQDERVHGIMVQLPVPRDYDLSKLIATIRPSKDVDGLRFTEHISNFVPATTRAVLEIIDREQIELKDKPVTLIGHGTVGAPLAMLLPHRGARLTIVDEHSTDLAAAVQGAQVVISAVGQPHLITADMIADGAAVIDVGVSVVGGKTLGDVDFEIVKTKASFITPPTGGVGPMTIIMLMKNVVEAVRRSASQ